MNNILIIFFPECVSLCISFILLIIYTKLFYLIKNPYAIKYKMESFLLKYLFSDSKWKKKIWGSNKNYLKTELQLCWATETIQKENKKIWCDKIKLLLSRKKNQA